VATSNVLTFVLTTSIALAAGGCGKSKTSQESAAPVPIQRGFQIGVYTKAPGDAEIPIHLHGKLVGTITKTAAYVGVEIDDSVRFSDPNNGLTATLGTTCGKIEVPLSLQFENRAAEDKARATFQSDKNYVVLDAPTAPMAQLLIDNVGGKATQVSVGERVLDVPANDTWVGYVRMGPCAQARTVKIAGAEVGGLTLPTAVAPMNGGGAVRLATTHLVDVKGGHCYLRHEQVYATELVNVARDQDQTFKGARVYPVQQVTDFLVDAPQQLKVPVGKEEGSSPVIESRYVLNRCGGTPKR
jgi:hypothetical protein